MKILHTSDWHLGRSLYGRKRYEEFDAFLEWLARVLVEEEIDVLLVAGDVFDNTAPSNRSQEMYYRFLCRVAASSCRHVVIVAGNHDSPSFLDAPRDLLRHLQIYIVGSIGTNSEDEVLVLKDNQGETELIICAVPYLRDRDIRSIESGETIEDKDRKLVEGIRDHYTQICQQAADIRDQLERRVPIIAMGHLFAAGGRTVEGDGVRELYVGSLAHVGVDIFPDFIDYLALGHLHSAQTVGGQEKFRYAGAPLPMGFGEAGHSKSVIKLDWNEEQFDITPIEVPLWQKLCCVRGDREQVAQQLNELISTGTKAWLEIVYEGKEIISDLREQLETTVAGSELEILRVFNQRIWDQGMSLGGSGELLSELDAREVFERCMDTYEVPDEQRVGLLQIYDEVVNQLDLADRMAE
ncbi:MAG TPA: exonuclease SbcCD subunit D C-terminal domain-containing protein [Syntrophomonas sp.]|nr:exonuclease SbcCD subunit D C-terminal domain-containing protein [Syntrophomonas sp.]HPT69611.1 exonuclease SbcCD subunit D C-terminal domain-containing protein [Syntrophomonas sp.]